MPSPLRAWPQLRLAVWILLVSSQLTGTSQANDRENIVFFETKIRPVLVDRCYSCHSGQAAKSKGGLKLDSREALRKGGDSGPALVLGKPDESLIIRAMSHAEDVSPMPPKGRLPDAVIADFRRWISLGATDPRDRPDPVLKPTIAQETWWSLKPITKPAVPSATGAASPIDAFIRAKLKATGLSQNPEADRRTLIRRVSLDLTGLPPTPQEIDAFLNDARPEAYERLVDRLLGSPHYGERWARHWMDAVHFAESHGHDQDRIRPNAWPYRDYLIQAFNRDTLYARFVQEQVAGDILFPDEPNLTVALGFLSSGPWDESSLRDIREDTIDRAVGRYLDRDDMVTTTMSTFVGLTVGCARCHDHKFDPIPQSDYYALQAVFAGVDRADRAFDPDPAVARLRLDLTKRREQLRSRAPSAMADLQGTEAQKQVAAWESRRSQPAIVWRPLRLEEIKSEGGATLTRQSDESILSSGKSPEREVIKIDVVPGLKKITGIRLEVLPDDRLPTKGPGRSPNGNLHLTEFRVLNRSTDAAQEKPRPISISHASADFNQEAWGIKGAIDGNSQTAWGIYPSVGKAHQAVFELGEEIDGTHSRLTIELQQSYPENHPIGRFRISVTDAPRPVRVSTLPDSIAKIVAIPRAQRSKTDAIELAHFVVTELLDEQINALPRPQLVFAAAYDFAPDGSHKPAGKPRTVQVLRRGDIRNPGAVATPGTLGCLPGIPGRFDLPVDAPEGARRKALALWLTGRDNPLVWRTIVNRVWQHHFGRGIVDTPSDFGKMGSPPSHPELLDWLAAEFRDRGQSLKSLHRLILLSATYRQASASNEAYALKDVDNRLLWRQNRQRLDAESVRDAVLLSSGALETKMGGPSVQQFTLSPGVHVTPVVDYQKYSWNSAGAGRRSIYRFLFRTLPDPFMDALDSADASQLIAARNESLTALQALTLLNNRFMIHYSEELARQLQGDSPESAMTRLYRLILGRNPTPDESRDWVAYVKKHGFANTARLLFNSNEFLFID